MSTTVQAPLTSAYFDLYSKTGLEGVLYDGPEPEIVFGYQIQRNSWFAFFQTPMRGEVSGDTVSWKAARSAHFLLHTWAALTTPKVMVAGRYREQYRIAFTRNLLHHVMRSCSLKANELSLLQLDAVGRDNLTQHEIAGGKWEQYNRMIGNVPDLVNFSDVLPSTELKMPLVEMPWELAESGANALPLCALKLNEIRIEAADMLLDLEHLIRVQQCTGQDSNGDPIWTPVPRKDIPGDLFVVKGKGREQRLPVPQMWAEYALVDKRETEFHAKNPKTYLIHQYQRHSNKAAKADGGNDRFDFKFNGAVKGWWLNAVNQTSREYNNYSNYTTNPVDQDRGSDPLHHVSLYYEGQARFENFPASILSDIIPFYHSKRVPLETGYHYYAHALALTTLEGLAHTNYGPLQTALSADVRDSDEEEGSSKVGGCRYQLELRAVSVFPAIIQNEVIKFPSYNVVKVDA